MMIHTCNPNTQETEVGGSWVWSKPRLHDSLRKKNGAGIERERREGGEGGRKRKEGKKELFVLTSAAGY
jgi:hypothetical protein